MTQPAPLKAQAHFAIIPEAVLYHPDLTSDDVRLYGALMRHADSEGAAWPGRTRLARLCHISERGLDHSVDRLRESGFIATRARWTDDAGRIFHESGPGRRQTSTEYIVMALVIAHPPHDVRRSPHTQSPHDVRPNDRSTSSSNERKSSSVAPRAGIAAAQPIDAEQYRMAHPDPTGWFSDPEHPYAPQEAQK